MMGILAGCNAADTDSSDPPPLAPNDYMGAADAGAQGHRPDTPRWSPHFRGTTAAAVDASCGEGDDGGRCGRVATALVERIGGLGLRAGELRGRRFDGGSRCLVSKRTRTDLDRVRG